MEPGNRLLLFLGTLTLLLLAMKWGLEKREKRSRSKATEPAGSMTIGTREVQEDCFYIRESRNGHLLALADGMGEPYGGRIAARTAIYTVEELFAGYHTLDNPQYFFRKAFHTANQEILKALDCGAKGTASMTIALVYQNKLFYGGVGNVKLAVCRKGSLVEITTGHTINCLARERFTKGVLTREEAVALLENQRLYNYLGQDGYQDLELFDTPVTLLAGDLVLLMTDGLYDLLTVPEIEQALGQNQSCEQMAYSIIEQVNLHQQEEKDNASIVLLRVGSEVT